MVEKLSSEFFLRAKALMLANELRTDVRRLSNVCAMLGYHKNFTDLLTAVETSATTIHDELDQAYDNTARQVDDLGDATGPRFDTEADETEDKDEYADDDVRTQFVAGHWYQGLLGHRPVNVYVCARFKGADGPEVVLDVDGDEYIFMVDVSVGRFLHGKATEVISDTIPDYDLEDDPDDCEFLFQVSSVDHTKATDF